MRQAIKARRAALLLTRVAVDHAAEVVAAVDHAVAAAAVDHEAGVAAVVAGEDGEQKIEDDDKD